MIVYKYISNYTSVSGGGGSVSQLCPTLCDSMECITPGFPVLHCLLEFAQTHVHWVGDANSTISSSVFMWCLYLYGRHAHVLRRFSHVQLFAAPLTVACQVPLSKGFFRQGYWSEWPCPPPGDLPSPGINPTSCTSPALAGRFFTTGATWEAPEGAYNKWKMGSGTSTDFALRTWKIGLIVK